MTVSHSQTPIAEPDFLDLHAGSSGSTTSPFVKLPPADRPPVAHKNIPDALTISETPSEILQPSSLLRRSTEYGTQLAGASIRALKEEGKDHVGRVSDQIAAVQNIAKRRLAPHIPSMNVSNEGQGDEALPVTGQEAAQAPSVEYKHDVVLDMEGYHSRERSDRTATGSERVFETGIHGVHHEVKKQ